jgi:hypothetical protein
MAEPKYNWDWYFLGYGGPNQFIIHLDQPVSWYKRLMTRIMFGSRWRLRANDPRTE